MESPEPSTESLSLADSFIMVGNYGDDAGVQAAGEWLARELKRRGVGEL